jgi:hypothetical protein
MLYRYDYVYTCIAPSGTSREKAALFTALERIFEKAASSGRKAAPSRSNAAFY